MIVKELVATSKLEKVRVEYDFGFYEGLVKDIPDDVAHSLVNNWRVSDGVLIVEVISSLSLTPRESAMKLIQLANGNEYDVDDLEKAFHQIQIKTRELETLAVYLDCILRGVDYDS